MKIIITEEQNEKLVQGIKRMVEKLGIRESIKMFGGNTNIIKHAYENNPLEFMDNFKDLEREELSNTISYRKNGKPIILHNTKYEEIWFNQYEVWSFFEDILNMEFDDVQNILSQWLEDNLNLKRYNPKKLY